VLAREEAKSSRNIANINQVSRRASAKAQIVRIQGWRVEKVCRELESGIRKYKISWSFEG
jgi:hypothetical protein